MFFFHFSRFYTFSFYCYIFPLLSLLQVYFHLLRVLQKECQFHIYDKWNLSIWKKKMKHTLSSGNVETVRETQYCAFDSASLSLFDASLTGSTCSSMKLIITIWICVECFFVPYKNPVFPVLFFIFHVFCLAAPFFMNVEFPKRKSFSRKNCQRQNHPGEFSGETFTYFYCLIFSSRKIRIICKYNPPPK